MMNPKLLKLVKEHRGLFWSVGEDNLDKLSHESIVEGFLNFGDEKSVKSLLNILGTETVANIFLHQINRPRHNYHPKPAHFFKLYFRRHAPHTNPHPQSN